MRHEINDDRLRRIIVNAHRLLWRKYRTRPLWGLVSYLTGHGSTISRDVCRQVGLDPDQDAGCKMLKDLQP